jgi:ATP-dependent DNA ligase
MFREYQPYLPTTAMKAPSGKHWIFEPKLDGFRIIGRRVNDVVRLQTNQG